MIKLRKPVSQILF